MSNHTCPAGKRLRAPWTPDYIYRYHTDGTPCGEECKTPEELGEDEALQSLEKLATPLTSKTVALILRDANAAIRTLQEENKELLNLLAIIHRDGGHHTEKVGIEQSINDAHKVWAELRENDYNLSAQVGVLVTVLEYPLKEWHCMNGFVGGNDNCYTLNKLEEGEICWWCYIKKTLSNLPKAARKHREYVAGLEMQASRMEWTVDQFAKQSVKNADLKAENTRLREENEKLKIAASWANYD